MKVQLNIDSEQKCLQSRLETVRRRRVANGARQPVPFHAAGPATTNAPELCCSLYKVADSPRADDRVRPSTQELPRARITSSDTMLAVPHAANTADHESSR